MTSDAMKFVELAPLLNRAWTAPFIIFAVIASIYMLVGWSAFVGFGFMCMFLPLTRMLGAYQMSLQKVPF